jgi:hypothetical protein
VTVASWISCPSGKYTRIWSSPTFGPTIAVWNNAGVNISLAWNEYSANPPFNLSGSTVVGPAPVPIFVGPPSPYVELWIKPSVSGVFRAS